MSVADLYRNRGVNPLAVQGGLMRLPLDANTYGLWWCNEGSGSVLNDKAATPHNGTIVNPVWSAGGPWGVGLDDAAGSLYVNFGNYGDPTTGSLTVEAVIDAYGMSTTGTEWGISIMSKGGWGATGWWLGIVDSADVAHDGKILFITRNAAAQKLSYSTTAIPSLHTCYVAGVLDRATGYQRLFINGAQEEADVAQSADTITSTTALQITRFSPAPMTTYKGKLYSFRLSLAARSAAEILTNAKLMGFA